MVVFQLVALAAVGVVVFGVRLVQRRRFYATLPKPPHSLLWGHLQIFNDVTKQFPRNTAIGTFYTEIAHRYQLKEIFYLDLWPFGPSQMVLVHPDTAELVTTVENYPLHNAVSDYLIPLLGEESIGAVDDDKWKTLHRMLAPTFRPSNINAMTSVIAEQVCQLLRPTLAAYAQSGQVFSMEKAAAKLIFGISSKAILGSGISEEEDAQLHADMDDIVEYATTLTITTATNPITKARKWWRKRAATRRVDSFLESVIKGRYSQIVSGSAPSTTILDTILLNAHSTDSDPNPSALWTEFVRIVTDNLKGLLLGGYGTTADTLCYIFIMLAFHPTVADSLRDEHSQVFGSDPDSTIQTLQQNPHKLNELPYTTAIIKETLRLFPVGFGIRKTKPGSTSLTYNGSVYPTSNQMIIPCTHTIHYDPDVFPHPTKFDPTRFLDPITTTSGDGSGSDGARKTPAAVPREAWRPFERGPRACLGQNLAMHELRIILLLTAREFRFRCVGVDADAAERRETPRALYTDLDLLMGDLAFQEMGFSAKARGGTMMTVSSG
ncbi:cytochrome P450 [Aspergillus pseudoustus]|uniref:Cytochrome P450 n=1 Tax=Aspergillus pseudoustus TaxID=1810923 RepID=A0ABR4IQ16_9EURO